MAQKTIKIALISDISSNIWPKYVEEKVIKLAQGFNYEKNHAEHVAFLSDIIFQNIKRYCNLTDEHRILLHYAAILHDIGWIEGQKSHHKTSQRLIICDDSVPLKERQRILTALIARYHRKALPSKKHKYFNNLSDSDRKVVELLGGILRIADGFDRTHQSNVTDIAVSKKKGHFEFTCRLKAGKSAVSDIEAATEKSDLLSKTLKKPILIKILH